MDFTNATARLAVLASGDGYRKGEPANSAGDELVMPRDTVGLDATIVDQSGNSFAGLPV